MQALLRGQEEGRRVRKGAGGAVPGRARPPRGEKTGSLGDFALPGRPNGLGTGPWQWRRRGG